MIDRIGSGIRRGSRSGGSLLLIWAQVVACGLLLIAVTSAHAAPSHYQRCLPPRFHMPGATLWQRGTRCGTARRVIAAFEVKAQSAGPDAVVRGFDCEAVPDLGGEPAIVCRRGNARVVLHGGQG